ncbi:uncharacterized membrane protein YfbV (UPF0208 family) [Rhodoblastus acidophilus]|nr:uncharacterized membrane protein YfbV (UPF0208 family) [Rhodoblastus acidophilus]
MKTWQKILAVLVAPALFVACVAFAVGFFGVYAG